MNDDFISNLRPVEGKEGLFRDPSSNAIVHGNQDEYDKYMASYNKRHREELEKKALQKEVSDLKSEMSDIKLLLLTLVQNQENNHGN